MPSSHMSQGDMPEPLLCLQCGAVVAQNFACRRCGYINEGTRTSISSQETQPSPAFNAVSEDSAPQHRQQLDQYNKRPQNISKPISAYSDVPTQSMPSVTPFLGIGASVPSGPGILPQSSYLPSSLRETASVTPFLGIAPPSNVPQIDFNPSLVHASEQSSSYVTQPTLIIPAEAPPERKSIAYNGQRKPLARTKGGKRKKRLVIVIAVIVLVCGSLGGYLFARSSPFQKRGGAVATPSPRLSKEPLRFVDSFKDNSNQWNVQSEPGKYSVVITKGKLVLEDDANSLLPELLPGDREFSNFKMEVDAVLAKGDGKNGYGVYIRCSADQDGTPAAYYRFELYGDSTYAIFKGVLDAHRKASISPLKLVNYTANSMIRGRGSVNHIEIDAEGTTMTLRINGQVLKTFSDTSYTRGTIALFISNVQNTPPGAQASFSNLVIDPKK